MSLIICKLVRSRCVDDWVTVVMGIYASNMIITQNSPVSYDKGMQLRNHLNECGYLLNVKVEIFAVRYFWLFSAKFMWRKNKNTQICDPVQQKGHLVSQVYSEITSKTVCKI